MDSNPIGEVFFALCKGLDTPRSLSCWLRYRYGEHRQLAEMKVSPSDYTSADSFACDYMAVSFLSKYKGLATGIDTQKAALDSFRESEERCKVTNERYRRNARGGQDPQLAGIFHAAQRKIARVLGPFSILCFAGDERWGPHAALDVSRREAAVDTKMTRLPITVTRSALSHLKNAIETDLHWSACLLGVMPDGPYSLLPSCFKIVKGGRLETVPKSAKTDRVIVVEPRGNGFLQKAVGAYIRKQLRRVGINLNDQGPNQRAARRGVACGDATLDLRGASDTICREGVFSLLPLDWALYMDEIRSPYVDGLIPELKLEKFSSMGNGFTFELESLIFWALCSAAVDVSCPGGKVLVYGDDIVVPVNTVSLVKRVLDEAGFELNDSKSFGDESCFRESCGKHYFGGTDVTPVYQKEVVSSEGWEALRMGNRIIRAALRFGEGKTLDPRFEPAWRASRRLAPSLHCYSIPLGTEGDDGWAVTRSDFVPVRFDPNRGYRVRVLRNETKTLPGLTSAIYAYYLRTSCPSGDGRGRADDLSFPTEVVSASCRWVHTTEELNLSW